MPVVRHSTLAERKRFCWVLESVPEVEVLGRLLKPRPSWLNLAMIALTGCCWRLALPLKRRLRRPRCRTVPAVPWLGIAGFGQGHEP